MTGWRWMGLMVLPVAVLMACSDDGDAGVSMHAALHSLAGEACEEIEAAAADERPALIARAVAQGEDEVGASPAEVLEILAEECSELLPPSE